MIGHRKVLALVPARGGSKGLPGKNILPVEGRPLLAWTIDAARAARVIDRIVLSSDDEDIMAAARACGCEVPFRRPSALATDTATSIDVVIHALDQLPGYEIVVLLQPTSPLRTAVDIDAAAEKLAASGAPACVSVRTAEETPYWMYFLGTNDSLRAVIETPDGITRRQDLPSVYTLNGAIYFADTQWLRRTRTFVTRETVGYVMPPERSLDIDTRADFDAFKTSVSRKPHADPVSQTPRN
jgi:CMP-N,N'-diacetyllegionaminic acid synthase